MKKTNQISAAFHALRNAARESYAASAADDSIVPWVEVRDYDVYSYEPHHVEGKVNLDLDGYSLTGIIRVVDGHSVAEFLTLTSTETGETRFPRTGTLSMKEAVHARETLLAIESRAGMITPA